MAISIIEHNAAMTSKIVGAFDEQITVAAGFSQWFPRETTPTYYIDIHTRRGTRKIAPDVVRFTEGIPTKLSNVTHDKFLPPYYELEYYFNRDEVYMNALSFGTMTNPGTNRMIARNAFENLLEQRLMIERSIRRQMAGVLQTGIITLVNGDNINFRRRAESMVDIATDGGVYWNNSTTATPLADIATGAAFLRNIGTASGNELNLIARSNVIANLMATTQVKDAADLRWIERVNIGFPQFTESTGFTFNGQIAAGDFRVNLWSYDEFYEDENEVTQYYMDEGNVVLLPANFEGKTVFGGLYGMKDATVEGVDTRIPAIMEKEYSIRGFSDEKTMSSGLIQSSAPIVLPITVDRIYTMKVLA